MGTVSINNLPDYAEECKYWVATIYDHEFYFYGAYDTLAEAELALDDREESVLVINGNMGD